MKKGDLLTIKKKPVVEIEKELRELRAKLVSLKFDLAAGKVKNIQEVHTVKKSIAQLLTVLTERSKEVAASK